MSSVAPGVVARYIGRPVNRPTWSALAVAIAVAAVGCSPDDYRRDADRQVHKLIREEQQRAIDYTPAVETPITQSAKTTKKSYEKLPTTAIPDLLENVVLTTPTGQRDKRRVLGPPADAIAPVASALKEYSAVGRVRAMTRQPYVLGPTAAASNAKQFGLFEAIAYAIENSREYQGEMESLYVDALDVTLQRHLFDPRPFANIRDNFTGGQRSVDYRAANTVTGEVGVRQQLPYGGEIVASALVQFIDALSTNAENGENATLALTGSIPLLRDAGMVNLEPLIQSERDLIYSVRNFETYRRNFAIRVATAYFRLITSQQSIRNRYVRYVTTIELTNRTEALFDAGRITALEVQRAQTELLQSEDDVNDALVSYENGVDAFKLLLGMPMDQELSVNAVQVDVPTPKIDVDLASSLARQYRLDLQSARDRIEDSKRGVQNAENNLLPDLNVTLGVNGGNLSGDAAARLRGDSVEYNAGIRLDLPLDRVAERNRYRVSLINLESAKRSALQLEDTVVSQIRASIRAIRSSIVSLELQREGIEIAQQRLEFANESLLLGRTSDSRNVVEAQSSLLLAQDRFEQARADLQIAILSYLRDAGVLRLDPGSGELGLAMERQGGGSTTTRPVKSE
jgi:outer membrane protein TolC